MSDIIQKCSNKNHEDINAIYYCKECKIYLCNKCLKLHSELFQNHLQLKLEESITGIFIEDIKNEKKKKLMENIKNLETSSNNIEELNNLSC